MSKKLYALICGIVGGVAAIAAALVTYFDPPYATAINGAIVIVNTAIDEVCALFRKDDTASPAA